MSWDVGVILVYLLPMWLGLLVMAVGFFKGRNK